MLRYEEIFHSIQDCILRGKFRKLEFSNFSACVVNVKPVFHLDHVSSCKGTDYTLPFDRIPTENSHNISAPINHVRIGIVLPMSTATSPNTLCKVES